MNMLRLQGLAFCLLATVSAAASSLALLSAQQELLLSAGLIIIFGVPHGAMDPVFAQKLYAIVGVADWIKFLAFYLLLGALVIVLWCVVPGFFLIGFLLFSLVHFSGDLARGAAPVCRLLYGGAIIVLPSLLHENAVTLLFSMLVGSSVALSVAHALHVLAWPWLIAAMLAALHEALRERQAALEMAALCTLATLASPLFAFAVYFCTMHGARHIVRTRTYAGMTLLRLGLIASPPMVAVLCMAALTWHWTPNLARDVHLIRLLFVALAALTVPHMALVERVRFYGWIR